MTSASSPPIKNKTPISLLQKNRRDPKTGVIYRTIKKPISPFQSKETFAARNSLPRTKSKKPILVAEYNSKRDAYALEKPSGNYFASLPRLEVDPIELKTNTAAAGAWYRSWRKIRGFGLQERRRAVGEATGTDSQYGRCQSRHGLRGSGECSAGMDGDDERTGRLVYAPQATGQDEERAAIRQDEEREQIIAGPEHGCIFRQKDGSTITLSGRKMVSRCDGLVCVLPFASGEDKGDRRIYWEM